MAAPVLTGMHFMSGNIACAEGALAAGCRFFAGYPITPSSEVAERMARRLPEVGGKFIQMEDEIASSIAICGASWAGAKAMTVTSGPGFSLMQEHIGYAVMTETPCVFVNIQRGGPSTGLPTFVGQGDMQQARWGSHGHYAIIVLCPASPQELFDMTVRAFNLAEQYRTPVLVMGDEVIGHMMERVVIPDALETIDRVRPTCGPDAYRPFAATTGLVPPMAVAGDGYRITMTGLTHDERGYPAMNPDEHGRLMRRIVDKIEGQAESIIELEEEGVEGADVVVVSYGITARIAAAAIHRARDAGRRVGLLRLKVAWPFADRRIRELAPTVSGFVVPEINLGQMAREVERCAAGQARVLPVTQAGGRYPPIEQVVQAIEEAAP